MTGKTLLTMALALMFCAPQIAEATVIDEAMQREREITGVSCRNIEYRAKSLWRGDINNDALDDVIVWTAETSCDRQVGFACNDFGCPVRLYVQKDDGHLAYVAQIRALSYEMTYRYGVRVIGFRIMGARCQKVDASRCSVITKIEGHNLVFLATEP